MGVLSISNQTANARVTLSPIIKPCRIFIAVSLLLLVGIIVHPDNRADASPDAVRWTEVSIPANGQAGNWVLASGSDVRYMTTTEDGTLYACVSGLANTLYKSADDGRSWSHVTSVPEAIIGIAVSPHDTGTLYFATVSSVYHSTSGGMTFIQLPPVPGGAGTNNKEITSIDVTWANQDMIAVGTRDTDNNEYGSAYIMNGTGIPSWTDTDIGSYDVYYVAFSPDYASDFQLVAVITDEVDTFTTVKIGDSGWNAIKDRVRLDRDNSGIPTPVSVKNTAVIAFPDGYSADVTSGKCSYYVAIDTGASQGDVYRIDSSTIRYSIATDLNVGQSDGQNNIDITGLACGGDNPAIVIAGDAASTRIYASDDGGLNWTPANKAPTGEFGTRTLIHPSFTTTGTTYAFTSGSDSAISISRDFGATWNQISLIDTTIDSIVSLTPSPDYSQDTTLFMLTFGGGHSLWRSRDSGNSWERILAEKIAGVDTMNLVSLPPHYGDTCRKLFIAGESNGSPALWESVNDGQHYTRRFTHDPGTNTNFPIDICAVADESTLFIGSYDGTQGVVYRTINSGFFYDSGAPVGSQPLCSIQLSPAYQQDGTILAGNIDGWVYLSQDNGASFQPLPGDVTSAPLNGSITVAFDPEFDSNRTVYATSDSGGIYRFVIGTSKRWVRINNDTGSSIINHITLGNNGTLYTTTAGTSGGLERTLDPHSTNPVFETVTGGLDENSNLFGLWQSGNRLWSIDTNNTRLVTLLDTLSSPVSLVSPADKTSVVGRLIKHSVNHVSLDWEAIDGATSYQWQFDIDADFSSVSGEFEGTTTASHVQLPPLVPATTYCWRIRASAPVSSPWSEKWSFTTVMDIEPTVLNPENPMPGAIDVPLEPVFQWTAIIGAEAYELMVATDTNFTSPAIVRTGDEAIHANAWKCTNSLDCETTYFWKVRATGANSISPWSSIGTFTTRTAPLEDSESSDESQLPDPPHSQETISPLISPEIEPSKPLPTTPVPSHVSPPQPTLLQNTYGLSPNESLNIPTWLIYTIGGLLAIILLSLVIILVMVLKLRRL